MTEIGRLIRIINDPGENPDGFRSEVEQVFNQLMEQIDNLRGLRGDSDLYGTLSILDDDANAIHSMRLDEIEDI